MRSAVTALSRILACILILAPAVGASAVPTSAKGAARNWVEGTDYVVLDSPQHTRVPAGKVEVMEVFSFACPGCNRFEPLAARLKHDLPANAQMTYLPASFRPDEDFPVFQQAYFTAEALGIESRTHEAIFDAIWKTGELAVDNLATGVPKRRLPTIEDTALCYQRLTGVTSKQFLATARSFGVNLKMRQADAQIKAMQVPGTPCIIVNGKYRVDSIRSYGDLVGVVRYLVGRESQH
jgi:thiol:disulfide interchange protein DsbA